MRKLPRTAYVWALRHLATEGDSDLFPKPFELDTLLRHKKQVLDALTAIDIGNYIWRRSRTFMVPKGGLGFRAAAQLHPIDSIVLAALVKKYGKRIETGRVPVSDQVVYSYRFDPRSDGRLYGTTSGWNAFWERSLALAFDHEWVGLTDIADFYNQIYHHPLENELRRVGLPEEVVKALMGLLSTSSDGVSRGVPVGPHAVHILAEASLTPLDRSLQSHPLTFCRYVDDYHFFSKTREGAEEAIFVFAELLHKHHRMIPAEKKTRVLSVGTFIQLAERMIHNQPASEQEELIIKTIRAHTSDDPYDTSEYSALSDHELEFLEPSILADLFESYLSEVPVNYARIGWLLRRLAQVGAPGALRYVIENIARLTPVLGDAAKYAFRASPNYTGSKADLGTAILSAIDTPQLRSNPYTQVVLLALFSQDPRFNHLDAITRRYHQAGPEVRREILLAARAMGAGHWIKERKGEFGSIDQWGRRALVHCASALPGDEGGFWLKNLRNQLTDLERVIAAYSLPKSAAKLGDLRFHKE